MTTPCGKRPSMSAPCQSCPSHPIRLLWSHLYKSYSSEWYVWWVLNPGRISFDRFLIVEDNNYVDIRNLRGYLQQKNFKDKHFIGSWMYFSCDVAVALGYCGAGRHDPTLISAFSFDTRTRVQGLWCHICKRWRRLCHQLGDAECRGTHIQHACTRCDPPRARTLACSATPRRTMRRRTTSRSRVPCVPWASQSRMPRAPMVSTYVRGTWQSNELRLDPHFSF
jgi:hypothetical protein